MSESIVAINYKSLQEYGEEFWIRMEQELPDDLATVAEAAEVIDKIFELDPCVAGAEDQEAEEQSSSEETMAQAKEVFLEHLLGQKESLCLDGNGCFAADVRVYRSHQDRPYTLLIQGGEEVSTIIGNVDTVVKTVAVKDASSVSMDLPADQPVSVSWQGPCYSKDAGRLDQSPEIVVSGGKIYWGITVSGVLSVRYSMPYDLVIIQTTEKDCSVTGLYHLSVDEIDLEAPPEDDEANSLCQEIKSSIETPTHPMPTCEELIKVEERCSCTNEVNDSYYKKELVPCLPGEAAGSEVTRGGTEVSYVYCGTKDEVSEVEYYKEKCCTSPLWVLPNCKKTYGVFSGGAAADKEAVESLKRTHGGRISFIPVGPRGGPCGEATTEQVVDALQCCDGVPELRPDYDLTQETMAPSSIASVYVLGGRGTSPEDSGCVRGLLPTREWEVSGKDVWLNSSRTTKKAKTSHNCVAVYSGPEACGSVHVYVTDGCSSTTVTLRVTVGAWTLLEEESLDGKTAATINCPISGVGTEISPDLYEFTQGKYKVIEGVHCGYLNGLPGREDTDFCAIHASYLPYYMPHPNWPGGITPVSTNVCLCGGYPEPDRCRVCPPGGAFIHQSLKTTYWYAYNTFLYYRAVYQWDCE